MHNEESLNDFRSFISIQVVYLLSTGVASQGPNKRASGKSQYSKSCLAYRRKIPSEIPPYRPQSWAPQKVLIIVLNFNTIYLCSIKITSEGKGYGTL